MGIVAEPVVIAERETTSLVDGFSLVAVDVTEPGAGLTTVYEVHCATCAGVDIYDQRSAAIVYGPTQHEHDRPTLESCICGEHRDCPDGWHSGADLPCSCTADCALREDQS